MARHKNSHSIHFPAAHWIHRPCIDWDRVAGLAEREIPSDCQRKIGDYLWVLTCWLMAGDQRIEKRDLERVIASLDLIVDTSIVFDLSKEIGLLRSRLLDCNEAAGDGLNIWYRQVGFIMAELQEAGLKIANTIPTSNSKSVPKCRKVVDYLLRYYTGASVNASAREISIRHLGTDKALANAMERAWKAVPQK